MRSHQKIAFIAVAVAMIGLVRCSPVKSSMMKAGGDSSQGTSSGTSNEQSEPVSATVVSSNSTTTQMSALTPGQIAALYQFRSSGEIEVGVGFDDTTPVQIVSGYSSADINSNGWNTIPMHIEDREGKFYLVLSKNLSGAGTQAFQQNTKQIYVNSVAVAAASDQ